MIGEGSKVPEQVEGMGAFELEVQCAVRGATEPGRGSPSTGEGWLRSGGHGYAQGRQRLRGQKEVDRAGEALRSPTSLLLSSAGTRRGGPWHGRGLLVSKVVE